MFDVFDTLILGPIYASPMTRDAVLEYSDGYSQDIRVDDLRHSEIIKNGPKGAEIIRNAVKIRRSGFVMPPPSGTVVYFKDDGSRHRVVTHRSDVSGRGEDSGEWILQLEKIAGT